MNAPTLQRVTGRKRRAVVVVQVVLFLAVLMGFAAFTIDVGTLYRARAELQNAADSAALASASAYTTDSMLQVRTTDSGAAFADVLAGTLERASYFASLNSTLGSPTLIETFDIQTGWIDVTSATSPIVTSVTANQHNAVRVTVRREGSGGNGSNGPVQFFFAPVFGGNTGEASASAVAVFDDRFLGYDLDENGAGALPFSMDRTVYETERVGGGDRYGFDRATDSVTSGSDGIPEVNLYPHDIVPGNFGLLNIGSPNQGVPALRDQIENGISSDDMEAEIGTAELIFFGDDGDPVAYQMTGDPGMKVALESSVEQLTGTVVGFFLHHGVTGNGSNSVYTVVDMRFGRLMNVKLDGAPTHRGVWIQPVIYHGGGVRLGKNAPSSGGTVGRLVLAR